MKLTLSRAAAPLVLFVAIPAFAAQPEVEPKSKETSAAAEPEEKGEAVPAAEPTAKEEKRICRRVKTDMSSRRATKVCKTKDEWREFNQRR